jgi:succinoglycan biosynthesis transport protein ExoP
VDSPALSSSAPEPTPALRQQLRFVQRQGWLVLLVPLIALAAAAVIVQRQHSIYRASMGIVVAQAGGPYLSPLGNQSLSQTMRNLLSSNIVARRVVDQLDLAVSPSHVQHELKVQLKPDSSVLEVSYDSPDKSEAVRTLAAVGQTFETLARERLGVSTSLKQPGPLLIVVSLFDPPHLNAGRVSPRPVRTMAFAGILGLVVGLILALARETLDDRIRGRREAEHLFGAPVIAALPRRFRARPARSGRAQRRQGAEQALQHLVTNVQLRSGGLGPTVLVASAEDDEVAAAVVANLGVALAATGKNVICVDADQSAPLLDRLLRPQGLRSRSSARDGFVDVLEGAASLDHALQDVDPAETARNGSAATAADHGRLQLLPVGSSRPYVPTLGGSGRLDATLAQLSTRADYVLIRSPSLLSPNAPLPLVHAVDSVLVVALAGETRRQEARAARDLLDAFGAVRVAVVLANAPKSSRLAAG